MDAKEFKVTCKNCNRTSRIRIIDGEKVFWLDHEPIIAARLRPDMKWGFECDCGNDSRVAPEEKDNLKFLVQGGEHSIERIAKGLKAKNEFKFRMEPA